MSIVTAADVESFCARFGKAFSCDPAALDYMKVHLLPRWKKLNTTVSWNELYILCILSIKFVDDWSIEMWSDYIYVNKIDPNWREYHRGKLCFQTIDEMAVLECSILARFQYRIGVRSADAVSRKRSREMSYVKTYKKTKKCIGEV